MKYKRNYGLGGDLSPLLAENLERLGWEIDIIIPIPLSRQRLQERGYNQVGLIAQPLSKYLRWEYLPGALGRSRHTRSQVGLSAVERRENVQGAFQASSARLQGKTVLLMDDVATTGSTLSAASQALLSSGAQKIYALTLAKAIHKYGLDSVPASVPVRSLS